MSAFWSMFWFKPFRNFLRKITILRNFDQWSEILSMSDGRPLSQGVCPSLAGWRWGGGSILYICKYYVVLKGPKLEIFGFRVFFTNLTCMGLSPRN